MIEGNSCSFRLPGSSLRRLLPRLIYSADESGPVVRLAPSLLFDRRGSGAIPFRRDRGCPTHRHFVFFLIVIRLGEPAQFFIRPVSFRDEALTGRSRVAGRPAPRSRTRIRRTLSARQL